MGFYEFVGFRQGSLQLVQTDLLPAANQATAQCSSTQVCPNTPFALNLQISVIFHE